MKIHRNLLISNAERSAIKKEHVGKFNFDEIIKILDDFFFDVAVADPHTRGKIAD